MSNQSRHLPEYIKALSDSLSALPGVGPKMASKLSVYLATKGQGTAGNLERSLASLASEVMICERCGHLADEAICELCKDDAREANTIMVVESPMDLVQIESASVYKGSYIVLGGLVSPINGVGPGDLKIQLLTDQITAVKGMEHSKEVEVILALSTTLEGEATGLFISNLIKGQFPSVKISKLGTGIPTGVEIEFIDPGTLTGALSNRGELG